jgi:glycosyltransferase involved in cell wall biosynthesis
MPRSRVVSALLFYPRGGSSHVARALSRELPRHSWEVKLVAGSRSDLDAHTDARAFYHGCDVRAVDFAPALGSPDPMRFEGGPGTAPMHPSYEDRPGAPDRVFAALDDDDFERQTQAWSRELELAGAPSADMLHIHHLTPLNESAARVAPGVPVVGQLHGTELLYLEEVERGSHEGWPYAERWAERMRGWAGRCERLLVAPGGMERAAGLLGLDLERIAPAPNGFDPERFHPREVDRVAHWRRNLVERPRGWLPGREAGSVRYSEDELAPFREGPVLLYVGRFTEVKRLPLLIRAFESARPGFRSPAALVLLGGHPGEWEGQHPAEVIEGVGARDVFLAGWHDHEELPGFLAASDAVVLPSVREQFGQVLVEGMACERPAVAADSFGPRLIIEDGRTGWLVSRDDEQAMAEALLEVVNDEGERRRRGREGRADALERFSWPGIAESVAGVFERAVSASPRPPAGG